MNDGSVVCDKNLVLLSDYDKLLEVFESQWRTRRKEYWRKQ